MISPTSKFRRPPKDPGANPTPIPTTRGVPICCLYCPGQEFRRSRLRSEDLRELLRMRYPVRCLRCSQRQTVSFTVAALSLSSSTRQPHPQQSRSSERHWTEPERMVLRPTPPGTNADPER